MAEPSKPERAALHERLHGFSHDVKNRMGGLWEAFRLYRDLPAGPERDELMAFAERSFFGGLRDVERLMDDLEVSRNPLRVERTPIDLAAMLERTVTGLDFRLNKKAQRVEITTPGPVQVLGDPHLLEQTFEALLSNAGKFSPRGSVIQVVVAAADGHADIQVIDPGVGLSHTDLGDIFTRYALLGSRSTDGEMQGRGTLARARRWMKVQDGSLEATSQGPGHGSTFTVRIPLAG